MNVEALAPEHVEALRAFVAEVPASDSTFFKEDITDARGVAERWIADERSVRRLAFDEDRNVVGFATLSPGVAHTSHVADLRLVVAEHARGQGLGHALARLMLIEAVQKGFKKVTVDIAADNEGPIHMFRELGFQPEALLRDHLCDATGNSHDIVVLAHAVDDHWSSMVSAGIDEALG